MPVYAYQCKSCQHRFDIRQSFADAALTECPECHRDELRKKFNTVGVSFKGSGFYSTDAKASSSAAASAGSSAGSGSGSDS